MHKNKSVKEEILREIKKTEKQSQETEHASIFVNVKDMAYTHAAITDSMRLYSPVAIDTKETISKFSWRDRD